MNEKFNSKVLEKFLPYVLGEKKLVDANLPEHEIPVAKVLGLVKKTNPKSDELMVWETNKNMITTDDRNFHDFRDQVENWITADFQLELSEVNPKLDGMVLVKTEGDDYGIVLDTKCENVTVIYYRHFTDTRCPWIDINGDQRRMVLGAITIHPPKEDGSWSKINGWNKIQTKNGKYVTVWGNTDIRISDFRDVPYHIREKILGAKPAEDSRKAEKVAFNIFERRTFKVGETFSATIDGYNGPITVSIEKERHSENGNILVDGVSAGTCQMNTIGSVFFLDITKNEDYDGNLVDLVNGAQEAVKHPEPAGKGQF
jgi:hypothetical protein